MAEHGNRAHEYKDEFAVYNYSSLIPDEENPYPDFRLYDFMVLGPFVIKTDGSFETEYFYEREKILDYDYLSEYGGEKNITPVLGVSYKNTVLGQPVVRWEKGRQKWGCLRFEDEEGACNDAVYLTQQRNCVFYASCYLYCEKEENAVIVHETSGCKLFLNGEELDTKPYGRVKGLVSDGYSVFARLKAGYNLFVLKIRPGYIADTIDMSISNFSVFPVCAVDDKKMITYFQPTALFFGDDDNITQTLVGYCFAKDNLKDSTFIINGAERSCVQKLPNIKKGCTSLIRACIPAGKEKLKYKGDVVLSDEIRQTVYFETQTASEADNRDFCFADFHFDTTYHQEQRTYAMGAMYITKCIVEKLINDRSFKAILSEIDYLHPYYSVYPYHRDAVKKAFEEKRVQADCFYNQPNELTSSGEAFVRNLVYGQLYHRDVLGGETTVYAPGDVFGHPNQMSQICLKGGCKSIQWGKTVIGLDNVFRHISPDGTTALHNKGVNRENAKRLGLKYSSGGADVLPTVHALTSDGKTSWMQKSRNYSHYAVFEELHEGLREDVEKAEAENNRRVDLVSRDMTQHHSGTLLTRTDFKQANRLCENTLVSAEKMAAISSYYGAVYPEKALDKAWRQLICAQHHDSVTGTNNEISFVDLMIQYREALTLASDVLMRSCSFIADSIKNDGDSPLFAVFNQHEWERTDVCKIVLPDGYESGAVLYDGKGMEYEPTIKKLSDGHSMAVFTCTVPAMGYKSFTLGKKESTPIIFGESDTIENEYYSITVDRLMGGGIISLYDKKEDREVIDISRDGPANRVVVLREVPERMEPQHEIYTTGQKMFSSDYTAQIKSEKCEEYQKLYVTVKLDVIAVIRQEITLYKGVKRIDMKTLVDDYQGRDDLFCLTFPINLKGAGVIFDDRFAPHVFSKSRRKLSFQTHQYASFSHSKIAPVNQWLELGNTTQIATEKGRINIGMTAVIRNPSLYKETDILLTALTKRAIPVTPYSDTQQYGGMRLPHFNEDLDNTDTRFVLSINGTDNEYETELLEKTTAVNRLAFMQRLNTDGISVLYIKDSNNIYKKSIDVVLIKAINRGILTRYLDGLAQSISENNRLELKNALLCDSITDCADYGVALINKGNICCSVEEENLMTMMLFHTADFYGNIGKVTGSKQLIPEQKTHSFSYALYAHSGDYAKAGVYRQAFEFNDRLISVRSKRKRNNLLESKSFLECDSGFVVTGFKAGGYDSAVMKLKKSSECGFCIRGFETDGESKSIKIKTGFKLDRVFKTDLLEENGVQQSSAIHSFSFDTTPYSIETFKVEPVLPERKLAKAILGMNRDFVEPTFVRSWEYSKGSMNMGYLAFSAVIGRDVEKINENTYRFNIYAANNHPDADVDVKLNITLPYGFKAGRKQFDCHIPALQWQSHRITVTRFDENASGIMKLRFTHDGQQFEDTYEFCEIKPRVMLDTEHDKAVLSITNPYDFELSGEINLASPIETWYLNGLNDSFRMNIGEFIKAYHIAPHETKRYYFDIGSSSDGLTDAFWLAAKIISPGDVQYCCITKKGERHNIWAHELYDELFVKDKGSIIKLLKY